MPMRALQVRDERVMNLGTLDSLTAALLLAWGSHALALPTGAQPVAGHVSVARPDARTLNVTQRSDKAIVNWATRPERTPSATHRGRAPTV
jgi:hypothetical protein